jgi:cardiolipin synthase
VPNLITLARICAVPLIVWFILLGYDGAAFWVFVAAGVSDALDGIIAKRFDARTVIGEFLDPIADKALLVSVYVALGHEGHLPTWLVILVVFRDVVIVAGAVLFETVTHSLTMKPLMISKLNTTAQIVLAAIVLGAGAFELALDQPVRIMVYGVGATTFLSGLAYVVTWTRLTAAWSDDTGHDPGQGKGRAE